MSTVSTPTNKFVVTQFARVSKNEYDNTGIVFRISSNPNFFYQDLSLNPNCKLQKLAKLIGINSVEIKDMSDYELVTYLTQRIEFQIPEELPHFRAFSHLRYYYA
jgi:hypothetical protein